jgi:hypothetical protein
MILFETRLESKGQSAGMGGRDQRAAGLLHSQRMVMLKVVVEGYRIGIVYGLYRPVPKHQVTNSSRNLGVPVSATHIDIYIYLLNYIMIYVHM